MPRDLPDPDLPLPSTTRHFPILFLHGFTSHLNTIERPVKALRSHGFHVETPVLRGHMTRWRDLRGVGAVEWYADAEAALLHLHSSSGGPVGLAGFSMGGVVALDLARTHGDKIRCMLLAAPALQFVDPLTALAPLLGRLLPVWPAPNAFRDLDAKARLCKNYNYFPPSSFASLYRYAKRARRFLPHITTPLHLLHSFRDQVIDFRCSRLILERTHSPRKSVTYLQGSGHELFLDFERDRATQVVLDYFRGEDSP